MYIVAIAWLYVTFLMALTESSFVAGVATLLFYGVLPLALFLWLVGTPQRRRARQRLESADKPLQAPPTSAPETQPGIDGKPPTG